ncbi:MAG: formylglycine-generating enzyme family protein [Wenzhouxiangellaceae bacterium]
MPTLNSLWLLSFVFMLHGAGAGQGAAVETRADSFKDCTHCPEMVVVPGGTFLFGSPLDEEGRDQDEGPAVDVALESFAVSRFEITLSQFQSFADATNYQSQTPCFHTGESGRWDPHLGATWQAPGFEQSGQHPVVCVSWDDAQQYIAWINQQADSNDYRLLTEAEWEYSAEAGSKGPYWWGEDQADFCTYTNGADQMAAERYPDWNRAGACNDHHLYTAPVGYYQQSNAFGLYDLVGNVWEWVGDCYKDHLTDDYYDHEQGMAHSCEKRVVRGGGWDYGPLYLRTSYRGAWNPAHGFTNFGFRIAKTLK